MQAPPKRLGEMLVEAGLITPGQLQSAITHQKIAKGRLGSNLVALGFITEEVLMDFLAVQTGVPRMDVRSANPPAHLLKLIPQRMAEQFTMLPVSFKEPKSLVLAMSDPLDLNALDSARFASGMTVEPVVASHSALRQMIPILYARTEPASAPTVLEVGEGMMQEGLPIPGFDSDALPVKIPLMSAPAPVSSPAPGRTTGTYAPDPFFDGPLPGSQPSQAQAAMADPFGLFDAPPPPPPPVQRLGLQPAPAPGLVPERTLETVVARLDAYDTRVLLVGLVKFLQRRGIVGEGELERFIANLVESGELRENRSR